MSLDEFSDEKNKTEEFKTDDSTEVLQKKILEADSFEDFHKENKKYLKTDSMVTSIRKIMARNNLDVEDILVECALSSSYVYQILNGRKKPSRDKIIALLLAITNELEDYNLVLKKGGYTELYAREKRDALIIFGISKHFDYYDLNELLEIEELKKL